MAQGSPLPSTDWGTWQTPGSYLLLQVDGPGGAGGEGEVQCGCAAQAGGAQDGSIQGPLPAGSNVCPQGMEPGHRSPCCPAPPSGILAHANTYTNPMAPRNPEGGSGVEQDGTVQMPMARLHLLWAEPG